jgi:hypothetical protein
VVRAGTLEGTNQSKGHMRISPVAVLLLALVLLAGCGSDDGQGEPAGVLSIEQALAGEGGEPVVVSGSLLAQSGEARLCSALAESFPPQCVGPQLLVEGLDLDSLEHLETGGGVTWSDRPVRLRGTVSDGVLTVSQNAPS